MQRILVVDDDNATLKLATLYLSRAGYRVDAFQDGIAALTDFGIAKDLNAGSSMTISGEVLGTPSYVAPEQAQGLPVGPAADVYSLGVMLFQMLAGRKPYQANDPQNILYQHINSPIPRLPDDLSQWQGVIDLMMAKSPQARLRDASAVLAVFRAFGFEQENTASVRP